MAPGILVCIVIAAAATLIVDLAPVLEIVGAPVFGILIGIALGTFTGIGGAEKLKKGISYTSQKVLQVAVVLLGFGLNLATVGKVGMSSLPIILSTIATSLIVAYIVFIGFLVFPAKKGSCPHRCRLVNLRWFCNCCYSSGNQSRRRGDCSVNFGGFPF